MVHFDGVRIRCQADALQGKAARRHHSRRERPMHHPTSNLASAGLTALLALFLTAATPASGALDPKARYGDSMVIGIVGDPGALNGATSSNFVEKIIASNVLSML